MFSYMAFLNLENEFLSSIFRLSIDEGKLSEEPLNYRFEEIDIFFVFVFSFLCIKEAAAIFLLIIYATKVPRCYSMLPRSLLLCRFAL